MYPSRADLFPSPAVPFVVRRQVMASLPSGERVLDEVEVLLEFDELGRTGPRGFVIGNNLTVRSLIETLSDGHRLPSAELSAPGIAGSISVERTHQQLPGDGPTGAVASFQCAWLEISQSFLEQASAERRVPFSWSGRNIIGGGWHSREVSYDGSAKVEAHGAELKIGDNLPFSLRVQPHFFCARTPGEGHEPSAKAHCVIVDTPLPRSRLTDSELVGEATAAVDDCALLVSFLSRARVGWHAYVLETPDRLVSHYRPSPAWPEAVFDFQDTPVRMESHREFLGVAVPQFQRLQKHGTAPSLAITHTLAATQSSSLQERFTNYFFAIERLREIHERTAPGEEILPAGVFKRLKSALGKAIENFDQHGMNKSQVDAIKRKLPELNRRTFADGLQRMMDSYGVEWRDLYPPDFAALQPRFIALRNELLHTGKVASSRALWYETIRLQGTVERTILKMLAWPDVSSAPPPRFRMALYTEVGGDEGPATAQSI